MMNEKTFMILCGLAVVMTAQADPNWTGGGGSTTEWATSANWTAHDGNGFWIDPNNGATSFAMTFNRDGRTYAPDPEDKSVGNWDFYNIWNVTLRFMNNDQIATWTGDSDDCGPHIRGDALSIGEVGRGALAIKNGKVTVVNNGKGLVKVGWGGGNTGELSVDGGLLQITKGIYLGMNDTTARGVLALNGGTLKTDWVWFGNEMEIGDNYASFIRGKGESEFHFNGGKIQAGDNNQAFPVDGATFAPGGLEFDTDGHNVALLETVNATVYPGATMKKTGAGTLAMDAPVAGALNKVEAGTVKFATDGTRTLAHRWSFTSDATDSVTQTPATETLGTVTYSDGKASLSGEGDCGINLGANLWPADAMTLEIWATYRERTKWAKLFSWSGMHYSFQDEGGWSKFALMGTTQAGADGNKEATGGNIEAGDYCCYTITLTPNSTGGTHLRLCRWNATTGELMNSRDWNCSDWLVSKINQENFWLGKSYWYNNDGTGDTSAKADYHEVRIWKGVFADTELKEHVLLGPDALPGTNGKFNTLNASATSDIAANDYLLHRWTFNNTLEDCVGGSTATLKGDATFNSSRYAVKLPGGSRGAGWVDLGETGGFPTNDTPFTIEIWHTMYEWYGWRRMLSMGKQPEGDSHNPDIESSLQSGIYAIFSDGSGSDIEAGNRWWKVCVRNNGADVDLPREGDYGWFDGLGNEFHTMISVIPDGSGNCTIKLYSQNARTGGEVGTVTLTCNGWTPSDVNKISGPMFNWLGHSQWGDSDPKASYNEVRIWNCALTKEQMKVNRLLGPDRLPHITKADADRSFALEVASGATADLCGNSATLTALSGAGTIANAETVTISGVLSPGGDSTAGTLTLNGDVVVTGTIRLDEGDKIVVNGTLDLSGATVEIIADNLSSSFVFASATSGITGVPAVAETGRWNKRCAIRGVGNEMRVARYGLVVVIK